MALRQQPMMCQQCTFHVLLLLLLQLDLLAQCYGSSNALRQQPMTCQ
jgi:hypothetical protein